MSSQMGNCVTPLMLACFNGRSAVVDILVEAKADINLLSGVSSVVYMHIYGILLIAATPSQY